MMKEFEGAIGVVEATSYERSMLKKEYESQYGNSWEVKEAFFFNIGLYKDIPDAPVCFEIFKAEIGGKIVLFLDPTSMVVSWEMIADWLMKELPDTAKRAENIILNIKKSHEFSSVFLD